MVSAEQGWGHLSISREELQELSAAMGEHYGSAKRARGDTGVLQWESTRDAAGRREGRREENIQQN